jgi:hypothetical protein
MNTSRYALYGLFGATLLSNLLLGAVGFAWLGYQVRLARENRAA